MSHDSERERGEQVSRRSVLKAVGAATVLGGAPTLAETVSAEKRRTIRQKQAEYASAPRARTALDEEAGDVLEALAERGLVPEATAGVLPTDEVLSVEDFADADEGLYAGTVGRDGEASGHLVVRYRTDGHEVTVVAQPERNRSFARVDPDDGDAFRIDPDRGEVTTEGYCWWETRCEYDTCGTQLGTCYEYECCESGGVTDCDPMGPTGVCCGQKTNC